MRHPQAKGQAALRCPDINALRAAFQVFWPFRRLRGGKSLVWLAMCAVVLAVMPAAVMAEDEVYNTPSNLPLPRWAMLKSNEVYARNGPSKENRVVWTYKVSGLPVQIISETREWRLICDPDGNVAWVSRTMLRTAKNVMSPVGQKLTLRKSPDEKADAQAILRPKSLASLDKCKKNWCRISAAGKTGWVPEQGLWGTQDVAVCKRPDPFTGK
jgi:SH3-like domain-containing protein